MITCQRCGKAITDIKQLTEVGSLGLALRGKCPSCGGWVFCEELWKKTKFIDRTHTERTRTQSKARNKRGHTKTPKARKNALELQQTADISKG
jgi:predicted ATP-dependent serine protease